MHCKSCVNTGGCGNDVHELSQDELLQFNCLGPDMVKHISDLLGKLSEVNPEKEKMESQKTFTDFMHKVDQICTEKLSEN